MDKLENIRLDESQNSWHPGSKWSARRNPSTRRNTVVVLASETANHWTNMSRPRNQPYSTRRRSLGNRKYSVQSAMRYPDKLVALYPIQFKPIKRIKPVKGDQTGQINQNKQKFPKPVQEKLKIEN